jgi:hypothetical protein
MEADFNGNLSAGQYSPTQEEFKNKIFNKLLAESGFIQIFRDGRIKLLFFLF